MADSTAFWINSLFQVQEEGALPEVRVVWPFDPTSIDNPALHATGPEEPCTKPEVRPEESCTDPAESCTKPEESCTERPEKSCAEPEDNPCFQPEPTQPKYVWMKDTRAYRLSHLRVPKP